MSLSLPNDLIGFGLYIGFFIATGLPVILLKAFGKIPFEITRKLYHLVITLSIFPLLKCFSSWYAAVLAVFSFVLIIYPLLKLVECSTQYKRIAVEREDGEFRRSFIIVQLSLAILITIFWGLLGIEWQYVAVVAVLAWGLGDAAAALVGKKFGRNRIEHRHIQGAKTYEGTFAMFVVAGLAIFLTLMLYADQPWHTSMTIAAIVAPVSATVELFSRRGMDTLTVPLAVAFMILPLVSLLAYLGF